jgi:hypothetical protein
VSNTAASGPLATVVRKPAKVPLNDPVLTSKKPVIPINGLGDEIGSHSAYWKLFVFNQNALLIPSFKIFFVAICASNVGFQFLTGLPQATRFGDLNKQILEIDPSKHIIRGTVKRCNL